MDVRSNSPCSECTCSTISTPAGMCATVWWRGAKTGEQHACWRVAQATTIGYEEYVGNKTTWRLVNRKWADAFRRSEQLTMMQLQEDSTLVCSRTTWRFYLAVRCLPRPARLPTQPRVGRHPLPEVSSTDQYCGSVVSRAITQVAQAVRERRNDVHLSLLSRELVDNTGRVLRALKERVEQVRGVPYLGKASPSSGFVATYLLLQVSLLPCRLRLVASYLSCRSVLRTLGRMCSARCDCTATRVVTATVCMVVCACVRERTSVCVCVCVCLADV